MEYEKLVPEPGERTSICGRLTFGFLSSIIETGNKRPLEENDIPSLDVESTKYLTAKLELEWKNEVEIGRVRSSKPRLRNAVLRAVDKYLLSLIVLLAILETLCKMIQPVLLSFLLAEMSYNSPVDVGILLVYSIPLCVSCFIQTLVSQQCGYAMFLMAVHVKASLIGIVYKKILNTRHHILAERTSGYLINLISKDMVPIFHLFTNLKSLSAPLEIILVFSLLWYFVGWQTFGGVIFSITLIFCQANLGNVFKSLQDTAARMTDKRLRLIHDVISGIRVLKMNAWEWCFHDLVSEVRRLELNIVYKKGVILAGYLSAYSCYPMVSSFVALFPFLMTGNHLTAQNVFTTLALLGALQKPVTVLFSYEIRALFQTFTTLERVESFLLDDNCDVPVSSTQKWNPSQSKDPTGISETQLNENQFLAVEPTFLTNHVCNKGEPFLCLNRVKLRPRDDSFNLCLCISDRKLIGITGPVGCGKSTLFDFILGEIPSAYGQINRQGQIAYVCQTPWVFSGTIRENIIFGKEFNQDTFEKAIEACSLKEDLKSLSCGDLTYVGERGVSLSGGQRARLNLARAVYSDADIYLLDDPLSSVDAKVSNEIFQRCICGTLSDRIRLLITHQARFLGKTDLVLLMDKESKMTKSIGKELRELEEFCEISAASFDKANERGLFSNLVPYGAPMTNTGNSSRLEIEEEDRLTGSVSYKTYWTYLAYGVSKFFIMIWGALVVLPEGAVLASSFWLAYWTKQSWEDQQNAENAYVYIGLASSCFIFALTRSFLSFYGMIKSSSRLHAAMLTSLLKTPVSFFDVNPAGRILNRFAKDVGCMDEVLPYVLSESVQYAMFTISILVLISVANMWIIGASVPFTILSLYVSKRYTITAREIKRIEAITNSPVCSHVTDTIQGITTVRVYEREAVFLDRFYSYQDANNRALFCYTASLKWLGIRLDSLSSVLVTVVTLAAIFLSGDTALSGLSISYCLQLSNTVQWMLQAIGETENYMTSVERVLSYTQLQPEPGYDTITPHTRRDWPENGCITFRDVSLSYFPGGPPVLKNISFTAAAGEKIGIVGRTGAGKSSLIACLLRMPANTEGEVIIDGICVADLNVQDVRTAIAVIPQSPFLFNDVLRRSLDPADKFSDEELWEILEKVKLKSTVVNRDGQLYCHVTENGANFSVGERQLICFARALLFGKKVIVMDEATSSVDTKTDELIQSIICKEMNHCTVLTIAHRLSTISDYDRIMVLSEGKIIEMDSPKVLLSNELSCFYQLYHSMKS